MTTCKNCGNNFEGLYCNQCRQPASTTRLTWAEVFGQLRQATVDVDRGWLFTFRELFLRPGITIRQYLEGRRVNYSNPFFYTLLLAGFAALLFITVGIDLPVRSINLSHMERLNPLMAQRYFILVGICFLCLLSVGDLLLYRKQEFNFAEIVVSNTFQAGQVIALTMLFFPLMYLQDNWLHPAHSWLDIRNGLKLVAMAYLVVARVQLFGSGRQSKAGILALAIAQMVGTVLIYELVIARMILGVAI